MIRQLCRWFRKFNVVCIIAIRIIYYIPFIRVLCGLQIGKVFWLVPGLHRESFHYIRALLCDRTLFYFTTETVAKQSFTFFVNYGKITKICVYWSGAHAVRSNLSEY